MTILRPFANVFGFAAALAVFFGAALSFVFSISGVHAAIEEAAWVRTTGTVVGTVPYHGKKGAVYHYAEYEYELGGEKYRCQGDRGWREELDTVGGTTELLVNPEPPHTVRFGSPTERWMEQAGRIGIALAVLTAGWVVGTGVKRIDPSFEHHPTQMAAVTFLMLTLLFVPVSCAGLIGAGRRATGQEASATVVAVEQPEDKSGNREYLPVFEYRIGENPVRGRPDGRYRNPPCRVGEAVRVRYDRLKADRVVWSPCDDGPNFLSPAWLVMTLTGALSVCLFVRSAWKYPAPPTQPAAVGHPDGTPSRVVVERDPGDGNP